MFVSISVISLLPNFKTPQGPGAMRCTSNLWQIGQGIIVYARHNGGKFPDDFGQLLAAGDIDGASFICPSTHDTAEHSLAEFAKPGHCSYLYLGKGLTQGTVTSDVVIAYEPLANHKDEGTHVLFGDWHVDFIPKDQAAVIFEQVKKGTWPVRLEVSAATQP